MLGGTLKNHNSGGVANSLSKNHHQKITYPVKNDGWKDDVPFQMIPFQETGAFFWGAG